MVDLYCASYPAPPAAVTLDIDDTVDVVHGHQQLSLFNAQKSALRGFAETRYQAKSWDKQRRVYAASRPPPRASDIRFVVTSLHTGSPSTPL
jgi:hypothetical protein